MSKRHRYARRLGLVIADPDELPLRRRKRGKGFGIVDPETGRAPPRAEQAHLRSLPIPPAWTDVRCARDPRSHILVVGEDGSGRRQYIYHPDWEKVRNAIKDERLLRFGKALPRIRDRVASDLSRGARGAQPGLRTVAAAAARLIDSAALRPGNEVYALAGHRGATTLRARDLTIEGDRVRLDYVGKSGKEHAVTLRDRAVSRVLRKVRDAPPPKRAGAGGSNAKRSDRRTSIRGRAGHAARKAASRISGSRQRRLFVYRTAQGTRSKLTAAKLNRYIAAAAEAPVSAKDFRTFIGSSAALEVLFEHRQETCDTARKRALAAAGRAASERLRNTPAVARRSYILPDIVEAFEKGELPDTLFHGQCRKGLDRAETALMRHMEKRLRETS